MHVAAHAFRGLRVALLAAALASILPLQSIVGPTAAAEANDDASDIVLVLDVSGSILEDRDIRTDFADALDRIASRVDETSETLTAGDATVSRHRHVLTNALGGTTENVQVDTDQLQLEDGDRLLLCTDGLTDLVDDQTITSVQRETTRSSDACDRLVQRALDNGGGTA